MYKYFTSSKIMMLRLCCLSVMVSKLLPLRPATLRLVGVRTSNSVVGLDGDMSSTSWLRPDEASSQDLWGLRMLMPTGRELARGRPKFPLSKNKKVCKR